MEILKGKKERKPEFNQYVSQIDQVTIDLDKQAELSRAYKRAVSATDFSHWEDADGTVLDTYAQLLDYQVDKFMKRYPPVFIRDIAPELVLIKDNLISWNKEALRLLWGNFDDAHRFRVAMDDAILEKAGYIPEKDPYLLLRESFLQETLDQIAITLNNLKD